MSTAVPQVPPRPQRAQDASASGSGTLGTEMPKVPPRPTRRVDRSVSPGRESFASSPLNQLPPQPHADKSQSSLYVDRSANASSSDLPARPPSVSLPSIGQEGTEYADAFAQPAEEQLGTSPTQTRNVANDLMLHAPKPSLPTSAAKQRVSTVTRTDSGQAAALGLGKATASDDRNPQERPLKQKASFASQASNSNSNGNERPASIIESEHGIPEIGQRVPMYPNAGDVQAPSPSPFAQPYEQGIGFHNDGSKPRNHGRRPSGRGHEIPPDAYGRYGHGVIPHDKFEKAYYEKHPELFKKELGHYGEGRPEWAMSSDDLNKIVRDTASRGAGTGAQGLIGTPSEQVGFQASEEYTSRMSSPKPQAGYGISHSNKSNTHVDSPLKRSSIPTDDVGKAEFETTLSRTLHAPSDTALESEAEDDVIHVGPGRRSSKIHGGAGDLDSREDLGPGAEDDRIHDEHGYGVPILASDEVAKEPFGYELQPAVSPEAHRHSSMYDDATHHRRSSQSSLNNSRPSSRPGSIHGSIPGLRLPQAPLEDLEEYEPLFPDEAKAASTERPLTAADKLKRPELKNRKFPSQDIWEDTPNSLQYTATVSTPELPEEAKIQPGKDTHEGETPAQAFARRQEELAEQESHDSESFLHQHQEKKAWAKKAHLVSETRPNMKQQRFPSRDIWEDTPDSLQLQTTVGGPQTEKDIVSPPDERPTTNLGDEEERATTSIAETVAKPRNPHVPARPSKSKPSDSMDKAPPSVPERPSKSKPVVPARPSKPITRESSENIPLSTTTSNTSAKSSGSDQDAAAAAVKPKPPVPSRPMGSKIAAMQSGFMAQLNSRLGAGPLAPKKEDSEPEKEEVKEKAPLSDARKGRARGPARRAPAKSPAPPAAAAAVAPVTTNVLTFSSPSTLWQIDPEEDLLHVPSPLRGVSHAPTKARDSSTPTLASNTAGEAVHESSDIAPGAEVSSALPSAEEDVRAEKEEEAEKAAVVSEASSHEIQPIKPSDEPIVTSIDEPKVTESMLSPETSEGEDLSASTDTLKAGGNNIVE